VPEDQDQKSVVIDRGTYGRLLRACNYKSKDDLEEEKLRADAERDRLIVILNFTSSRVEFKLKLPFLSFICRKK
jgi:hypothetical protein